MRDKAARRVHATCVAVDGPGGPRGVLLRGASGAGKSDLALRMIDQGARLVADDQCELHLRNGPDGARLLARAPAAIAGAMEVRGLGIVAVPTLAEAPVALLVDLVAPEAVERLPEDEREVIEGVALPRIALDPAAASAPAKVRVALEARASALPAAGAAGEPAPGGGAQGRRRVVLVTGLSGAGRSTALKALEDMGYEAIDNLPLRLLDAALAEDETLPAVAIGVDIRTRNFAADPLLDHLDRLAERADLAITLLFLDCDDRVLERRYTETRRRHPLALDRRVADGIAAERRLVAPLRARADLAIDTSMLAPGDLRRQLLGQLGLEHGPGMTVFLTSFAYRYGVPREADLVFDVRFLRNPHYVAELRPLDGRDRAVAAYIEADPAFAGFFAALTALIEPLLPRFEAEGKSYLTIAIGCTGGRHRSVFLAERLAAWFERLGRPVQLAHRDVAPDESAASQRP